MAKADFLKKTASFCPSMHRNLKGGDWVTQPPPGPVPSSEEQCTAASVRRRGLGQEGAG